MAECHPVGFQWVMEAKERGAKVFHVDPRFTRTSAVADEHLGIRVGTDVVFLGALINHVLSNGLEFREYVEHYTNASTLVSEDFVDADDLGGLFSGWDPESGSYDVRSWAYEGMDVRAPSGTPRHMDSVDDPEADKESQSSSGEQSHGAHGAPVGDPGDMPKDPTLQHPRCVFQVLKRHFARYTPEMVQRVCGIAPDQFGRIADAMCENSGRERTTAFVYSVGFTHHTTGTQYIRAASILQLLLGNMGRPGGGIMALRGHASIQGSTDIPTLYNLLPGYLPMPDAGPEQSLDSYIENNEPEAGFWGNARDYTVSLLKAWWGEHATAENDFCFDYLPRITGDHSIYPTVMGMHEGEVEGFFVMGENPTVGSANAKLHRLGMANLKWLVVRDLQMIESATFWKDGPEIETGELRTEEIGTEVFFLPAATHAEKSGTFTNTHRLLQWRHQAVEPPDDCRSELHFTYHLGRRIREKLAASTDERDRPLLELTWDYPTHGPTEDPDGEAILKEISGYTVADGKAVGGYRELKADGSTASGCWIYSGSYADEVNQTARRTPNTTDDPSSVAPEWGWAWPLNRRVLYNRASADPDGNPWSERKKLIWWDEEQERWTGLDIPDFAADMRPDYVPEPGAKAEWALRGDDPFVMQADGKGWLYAPAGLIDGPMPNHYEPHESTARNLVHPGSQASPTRQIEEREDNRSNPGPGEDGAAVYPFQVMTYRIAEHHTAGGMSRFLPHLAELAPDPYAEISPELAELRGLEHGEWATLVSERTAIEARVMVTDRMRPHRIGGSDVHTIGLPYHWGPNGLAVGDAANDLLPIVMDRNTHISEFKASTCDIVPGRRPRGADLEPFVQGWRDRANGADPTTTPDGRPVEPVEPGRTPEHHGDDQRPVAPEDLHRPLAGTDPHGPPRGHGTAGHPPLGRGREPDWTSPEDTA
jgi:formate dehydrogenase major subunit